MYYKRTSRTDYSCSHIPLPPHLRCLCTAALLIFAAGCALLGGLNEHLCPIRRHKRLKYMQAAHSSSQRIRRSKSWYHMHEVGLYVD